MAQTGPVDRPERTGKYGVAPLADDAVFYHGSMVALDAAGDAEVVTETTGLHIMGVCEEGKSEPDGDTLVKWRTGTFLFQNSGSNAVTVAHRNETVYAEDDETVGSVATGRSAAGVCIDVTSEGVWVKVGSPVVSGLAAANNLSDVGTPATARQNLNIDDYRSVAEDAALTLAETDVTIELLSSASGTKAATMTALTAGKRIRVFLTAAAGGAYTLAASGGTVTLDTAGQFVDLVYSGSAWRAVGGEVAA